MYTILPTSVSYYQAHNISPFVPWRKKLKFFSYFFIKVFIFEKKYVTITPCLFFEGYPLNEKGF